MSLFPLTEETVMVLLGSVISGVVIGKVTQWLWCRFAPDAFRRAGETIRDWYFYPFRWMTPDTVYKMYLREGMMSEENYRAFQEKNFIRDDLDPKYIQKQENSEN